MSGNTRLASANVYENAVNQLTTRQSQMSRLQEQLSAAKRVLRPSDDPTGAGQAERAATRLARVSADQRAGAYPETAGLFTTRRDHYGSVQTGRTLGTAIRARLGLPYNLSDVSSRRSRDR